MEYKVVLSDTAKADLARIYSYILNKLKSVINADAVLARLYSSMDDLSLWQMDIIFILMNHGIQWESDIIQSEITQLCTLSTKIPPP